MPAVCGAGARLVAYVVLIHSCHRVHRYTKAILYFRTALPLYYYNKKYQKMPKQTNTNGFRYGEEEDYAWLPNEKRAAAGSPKRRSIVGFFGFVITFFLPYFLRKEGRVPF